jgi:excisionase family DNA binding protein
VFLSEIITYNIFMELIGVTEAAEELGLSQNRVRQLIKGGKIPAQKIGNLWIVTRPDLEEFKAKPRKPGRPSTEDIED